MKFTLINKKAATHAGLFHADDVFASVVLEALGASVDRVERNQPLDEYDIVFDIGGGEFDHHHVPKARPNGAPLASFGLVWAAYGSDLLRRINVEEEHIEELHKILDESIVSHVDAIDCGAAEKPQYDITSVVSSFNGAGKIRRFDDDGSTYLLSDFSQAVEFAAGYLYRAVQKGLADLKSAKAVIAARDTALENGEKFVVLEVGAAWQAHLVGTGIDLVVYSTGQQWNLQVVPVALGSREIPFVLVKDERSIFVHLSGFLAAYASKEDAVWAARNYSPTTPKCVVCGSPLEIDGCCSRPDCQGV
jgi:uncharacterized UPF0160 family protein